MTSLPRLPRVDGLRRVLPAPKTSTKYMLRALEERIICAASLAQAQAIVGAALAASMQQPGIPSEPKLKEKL